MEYFEKYFVIFFFCVFAIIGCEETTSPSDVPEGPAEAAPKEEIKEVTIDLTDLEEVFVADTLTVEIETDHVFKKPKKYLAFPLRPILEKAIQEHNIDIYSTELIFSCTDGYKPSNLLQNVMEHGGGYLAFKDLDAPAGAAWLEENAQKYPPFLLVWDNMPYEEDLLPWPYGLFELTFKSADAVFSNIYPDDNSALEPAFELFKQNCMKCHSINKIGGIMGPEFNYPTNITTYWQREHIIAFAKNPQSYRYSSKMAAITKLSDEELNLIVDYLEYVKDRPLPKNDE